MRCKVRPDAGKCQRNFDKTVQIVAKQNKLNSHNIVEIGLYEHNSGSVFDEPPGGNDPAAI
jgi:hypothetical protein